MSTSSSHGVAGAGSTTGARKEKQHQLYLMGSRDAMLRSATEADAGSALVIAWPSEICLVEARSCVYVYATCAGVTTDGDIGTPVSDSQ